MDLYDSMTREEAQKELKRWKRRYERLSARIKLAHDNQEIARKHMTALFKRMRVAPEPPHYFY